MNQIELKKAVNILKTIANNYEETKLFKVESALDDIKIPVITTDTEVREFMIQHELYKPEKMINFFVNVGFSAVNAISGSIDDLKLSDLTNSVSKVESALQFYKLAMANPEDKKEYLRNAQERLIDATEALKKKVQLYIEKTREIDNSNTFFLKSMFSISKVDTYNECAKYGLKTIEQAIKMQVMISKELEVDIESSVIKPFQRFIDDELIKGDTCRLMYGYAKDKNDEFWLNVKNITKQIYTIDETIIEYKKEEIDYDNIEF